MKILEKRLDYAPTRRKINERELRSVFEEFCRRTAQKMNLQIWSNLLKKSLMENFIFMKWCMRILEMSLLKVLVKYYRLDQIILEILIYQTAECLQKKCQRFYISTLKVWCKNVRPSLKILYRLPGQNKKICVILKMLL